MDFLLKLALGLVAGFILLTALKELVGFMGEHRLESIIIFGAGGLLGFAVGKITSGSSITPIAGG